MLSGCGRTNRVSNWGNWIGEDGVVPGVRRY